MTGNVILFCLVAMVAAGAATEESLISEVVRVDRAADEAVSAIRTPEELRAKPLGIVDVDMSKLDFKGVGRDKNALNV